MTKKPVAIAAAYLKESRGMGFCGGLPWKRIREDMAFFQKKTMRVSNPESGKINAVVMGRRTWESLPPSGNRGALPHLPGRLNVVVSRTLSQSDSETEATSVHFASDLENALKYCYQQEHIETVWIIGGAALYKEAMELPCCQDLWLTEIEVLGKVDQETVALQKAQIKADTFFPKIPESYKDITNETDKSIPSKNGLWTLSFRHLSRQPSFPLCSDSKNNHTA